MIAYVLLMISVACDVVATSMLPASQGFTKLKPSLIAVVGYVICFLCFGFALTHLNLGIAYATWGAVGTVAAPIIGYLLYRQRITKLGLLALVLIIGSVVALNLYG